VTAKVGFSSPQATAYVGRVHVLDIGVPKKLIEQITRMVRRRNDGGDQPGHGVLDSFGRRLVMQLAEYAGRKRTDARELGVSQIVTKQSDQRAGDGRAGDGDPVDAARAKLGGNVRIGAFDVRTRIDDDLFDGSAGR